MYFISAGLVEVMASEMANEIPQRAKPTCFQSKPRETVLVTQLGPQSFFGEMSAAPPRCAAVAVRSEWRCPARSRRAARRSLDTCTASVQSLARRRRVVGVWLARAHAVRTRAQTVF